MTDTYDESTAANCVMQVEKTSAFADFRKWNFFVAGPTNGKSALLLRQLNDAGNGGASVTTWDASGMMSVYGGVPLGIDVGRVAIGGGRVYANDLRVQDGQIGIGPVTPIRQLHFGNSSGAEMVMEKTSAFADYKKWNFLVGGATNDKSALLLRQLNDAGSGGAIATTWDGNGMMSIYGTAPASVEAGRVAIGGGKIAANEARVNGLITAKEVRVTMSVWADSVFSPSYHLPTLTEVAAHIHSEGHLPGLPSEREVVTNGLSVGDMQRMHMAKIEELTLYAIEAKHQRDALQAQVVKQEQLLQDQAALLRTLQARLDRLEAK